MDARHPRSYIFRGQGQGWGSGVAGLPGPGPGGRARRAGATGSSMAPSTERKCTGRRVYSSSGYCMERMRCATRLATRYARYSLEPDVSASRVDAGALAGMPAARARTGEAGAARRGHRDGLPRCRGREAEAAARASRARPASANGARQLDGTHPRADARADFVFRRAVGPAREKSFRKVACVGVISWRTGPPEYTCMQY